MWNVDELKVYEQAMLIGEEVWKIVIKWDFFNKDTLGKQWIRAADSVALNISEGNGRFFYSDRKVFSIIAEDLLMKLNQLWLRQKKEV